jgi:catechol 2,3-dioxygenase-like lactoylglutathione lyase family enzyme
METVWTPMVLPTLKLLEPRLRPGAVIVADNVVSSKEGYSDFLAYIKRLDSPYSTVTLPYPGGLSLSTFSPMNLPADLNKQPSSRELFSPLDKTGRFPGPQDHIRIARPTRNIGQAQRFYVDGLGMEVLYRVTPEDAAHEASEHVDDLIMLGWPKASWHLELVLGCTEDTANVCLPQPTVEDLLVVYVDGLIDRKVVKKLVTAGGKEVRPKNPYWEQWGVTVEDPDGYRLVLSQRRWSNEEVRARWVSSKLS